MTAFRAVVYAPPMVDLPYVVAVFDDKGCFTHAKAFERFDSAEQYIAKVSGEPRA